MEHTQVKAAQPAKAKDSEVPVKQDVPANTPALRILHLQRKIGNGAVQRLIQANEEEKEEEGKKQQSVQLKPLAESITPLAQRQVIQDEEEELAVSATAGQGATLQHDPDDRAAGAAPIGARTALSRAEQIRVTATVRLGKVAAYNRKADASIAAYRAMRLAFAQVWGAAWERHSGKLREGNQQAATQNMIEGIVVGAAASVLAVAAGEVVFPTAAAADFLSTTWFAFNAGANVAGSAGGAAISSVVGRPPVPAPTAGRRDAEADAWQAIAQVESTARTVASLAPKFGLELGNAEYSIAQVQAHIDGGATDMTWDETLNMVSTLSNWERSLAGFDAEIDTKLESMDAFGQTVAAYQVPPVDDLEIEIWRSWMSTLDNTTDEALDQDVVQKHLVRLRLIPDYFYMSDEDQHKAVAEARARISRP